MYYRPLVGRLKGKRPFENLSVDGMIILKCINTWNEGMNWMSVDQDRDRWLAVVNAVMNLWIPQNAGNFLTS